MIRTVKKPLGEEHQDDWEGRDDSTVELDAELIGGVEMQPQLAAWDAYIQGGQAQGKAMAKDFWVTPIHTDASGPGEADAIQSFIKIMHS